MQLHDVIDSKEEQKRKLNMQPEAIYNRIESHDWSFCLEMWHANQIECHRWHHLINRRWQIDDSIEQGI